MNKVLWSILAIFLIVSCVFTADRLTWSLETFPVFFAGVLLYLTRNSFPLTKLTYVLIFVHCIILIYGGWYTYANTPFGDWLKATFELERNPYDRIGHFAQGFIPAIIIREVLLRKTYFKRGGLMFAIIVLSCLGISAAYEIIEWLAAVILEQGAEEFLGTQGDQWDTQWDMFLAGVGACTSLIMLSSMHSKQLKPLLEKSQ